MKGLPLDIYEDMPKNMKRYINNYGWHFTRKAYEYAAEYMTMKNKETGKEEPVVPYKKEDVDNMLKKHNVILHNSIMHDYVFVATMGKSDYLGSSIEDEKHLAMFIKDYVDDIDGSNELPFRRWVATMVANGNPIDWDELC